jgi:hypothetical protein
MSNIPLCPPAPMQKQSPLKIIICGVVKNVASVIEHNIKTAMEIGDHYKDYKIVLYENNSTDDTKRILSQLLENPKTYGHLKVMMENLSPTKETSRIWAYTEVTGSDHPCRVESLCNARNQVVEEINQSSYRDYDVVVWVDLDAKSFDVTGVVDSIEKSHAYDIILFGNSPTYYDYYALRYRSYTHLYGPEIIGEAFWTTIGQDLIRMDNCFAMDQTMMLHEVYSAYNGIGVYPKKVFEKYKYDCIVNDTVKEVYRKLVRKHGYVGFEDNMKNPCTKFPGGQKDEDNGQIFWKANSGYDQPVICEHVALNFAVWNAGYKLYINPAMMYIRD